MSSAEEELVDEGRQALAEAMRHQLESQEMDHCDEVELVRSSQDARVAKLQTDEVNAYLQELRGSTSEAADVWGEPATSTVFTEYEKSSLTNRRAAASLSGFKASTPVDWESEEAPQLSVIPPGIDCGADSDDEWIRGFGNHPDADECAEWEDANWEEGEGEVMVRAGDCWEAVDKAAADTPAQGLPTDAGAAIPSDDEEEPPAGGERIRYRVRYSFSHPVTRIPLCSAGDVLRDDAGGMSIIIGGVVHDSEQNYARHYTVEYLLRALDVGAVGVDEDALEAMLENAPVGLLILWVGSAPGAQNVDDTKCVRYAAVVRLMGRDSGIHFPSTIEKRTHSSHWLEGKRTADQTELATARAYVDGLDDRALWNLLRNHCLAAPQPAQDCNMDGWAPGWTSATYCPVRERLMSIASFCDELLQLVHFAPLALFASKCCAQNKSSSRSPVFLEV